MPPPAGAAGTPIADVLIVATGVTRVLPGVVPVTLVHDIDLTIGGNEFVAINGPSGSGKSSLLYLLGLLDLPTAGEVRISGRATAHMDEAERAATRLSTLGFVFQFHFLLPEFSALENVTLPMKALGGLPEAAMRERASSLLASLGLAEHALKRPDQLSGGQRQRVAVARACQRSPAHSGRRADRLARFRLERAGIPDPARPRRPGRQDGGGRHPRSRLGPPHGPPHRMTGRNPEPHPSCEQDLCYKQ